MLRSFVIAVLFGLAAAQSNPGFDLYVLVRQWGPTYCSSNSCSNPTVNVFTIHGLWPEYTNGQYPQSCSSTNKFSTNNLASSLRNQMACEWVSFTGSNEGFWSYEWGKHGTCSLSVLPTQQAYFQAAIDANNRYEPNSALTAAGINPATAGSSSLTTLQNAFKSAWGVTPRITCYAGKLSEVWLCLDLNLNAITCPSGIGSNTCSSTVSVPKGLSTLPSSCASYYSPTPSTSPSSTTSPSPGAPPAPPSHAARLEKWTLAAVLAVLMAVLSMLA